MFEFKLTGRSAPLGVGCVDDVGSLALAAHLDETSIVPTCNYYIVLPKSL